MKWILFVLVYNTYNGQAMLGMQEFGGAQACADAAIELERRARGRIKPEAWCMPMDAREKPNGKKSSWM